MICNDVVWNPGQCEECDFLVCSHCKDKWLENQDTCPNCRKAPFKLVRVNRHIKSKIEQLKFKCDKCDGYTYTGADMHYVNCEMPGRLCIFDCQSTERFKDQKAMKSHIMSGCEKAPMMCTDCDSRFTGQDNHNYKVCCEALKKELTRRKISETFLKDTKKSLEDQLES